MDKMKRHLVWWGAGILVAVAAIAWWMLRPAGIPEGFAASNGRIEATEVDIATKIAGRIDTILVSEGQFVRQGEVLAKMDTRVLQEQRLEAIAQIKEAESAVAAARALLEQRQSEMRAAQSVVKQREAELDSVSKRHVRSRSLSQRGAVSVQQLDDDRAAAESARAALETAKAQVSAAKAAIEAARTSIIQAQTRVEAAQATERRIVADIDDSELKAPRDGRVQYRVAEPGEVLSAGGRVLNMVDLSDVYMTFFLPTEQAGLLKIGVQHQSRFAADLQQPRLFGRQEKCHINVADIFPADRTGGVVEDRRRSATGAGRRAGSAYSGDNQFCRQRGAVHAQNRGNPR
ncbi:membrane protein [Salmonella enterica subsp. enterica serovar Worthington str. BCH-5715]|nr:membrane protein [Salmonella enterica subsp. enterica serovar Worthington str. BCH-5715]